MRNLLLISTFLSGLLIGGLSCGSSGADLPARQVSFTAIYGSSTQGITLTQSGQELQLSLEQVPAAGSFLRLQLPEGLSISGESWSGDPGVIHLAVATEAGAEVGLARTRTYGGGAVTARLQLAEAPRHTSIPPLGQDNLITDLQISDAGGGNVGLDWTQVNTGDYDFNGEVNVADLTPLGMHLGETYDRQAPAARTTTQYWIDGDQNGEINISDLSPIGANYHAYISGYVVQQNGLDILNGQGGLPSVLRGQGIPQPGLPPRYSLVIPGAVTDSWVIAPQDAQGNLGSDSGGNAGGVDLRASLNIAGLDLFNMTGTGSGVFGNGKFATRVIDPIDIVGRPLVKAGTTGPLAGSIIVSGLRGTPGYVPGKLYFLDVRYAPVANLANGAPRSGASLRGGSSARGVSEVTEDEIVTTSVPFRMPMTATGEVEISAEIVLAPNPAGGYFVNLDTTVTTPGDDPTTPLVTETSYTNHYVCRLDFANGLVRGDSDLDGSFDDEAELEDNDLDCVSGALRLQRIDDEQYEDGGREEVSANAIISSFDEASGVMTLTSVTGEGASLPASLTVLFSQLTSFEERVKTQGDEITRDLDPATLAPGDTVEVEFYGLAPSVGGTPDVYWAHKIRRRIEQ